MDMQILDASSNEDKYLIKPNNLIQLNQYIGLQKGKSLSLLELKLFDYGLSFLDPNSTELKAVRFRAADFWRICGKSNGSGKHKMLLDDALKELSSKSGWILRKNPETNRMEKVLVRLLHKAILDVADGSLWVTMIFDPDLSPILLEMVKHGNYTKLLKADEFKMESVYGLMLYQLICSNENRSTSQRYTFADLAERLDATQYDRPSSFKLRVTEAGMKDINKNSRCIRLTSEYEKTGKTSTAVTYHIERINGIPGANDEDQQLGDPVQDAIDQVKEQIGYAALMIDLENGTQNFEVSSLDLIVDLIADVYADTKKYYRINQCNIPGSKVLERFRCLDMTNVITVLENIKNANKTIRSPRSYVRSVLFNAPLTDDLQIQSRINAELEPPDACAAPSSVPAEEDILAVQRFLSSPELW